MVTAGRLGRGCAEGDGGVSGRCDFLTRRASSRVFPLLLAAVVGGSVPWAVSHGMAQVLPSVTFFVIAIAFDLWGTGGFDKVALCVEPLDVGLG